MLQQQVYKAIPALPLTVDPDLKTLTFKTQQNIRIVLTNKKGSVLTILRGGEQMSFAHFFADTLYRDNLWGDAMRLNIPNLEFKAGVTTSTLLHPLIPVPIEE